MGQIVFSILFFLFFIKIMCHCGGLVSAAE